MELARQEILDRIRASLEDTRRPPTIPSAMITSVPSRLAGDRDSELALLFSIVEDLGGKTRRISKSKVAAALGELVRTENVKQATLWESDGIKNLGIGAALVEHNVEMIPAWADKQTLTSCDLGVTGVSAALAQSGTLALVSAPEQSPIVSLLPRVHLAILRPSALVPDLRELFGQICHEKHSVLISGPSRTTDIEKVLTLGVHGPKTLVVWCVE